ncbi:hypothetical protein [Algoriphagus sp. Y33]|uniref:hypothetical protein n=1 Tax=Algoriphagus sp. Y33 TaxID=2772483 RepID=UPI00178408FE|nr:hypothetical protein [Algoriphagus sp. Y33]
MKNLILFGLVTFFTVSLTSCLKEYECKCPAGTTAKVKTTTKAEAKKECEAQSGGGCTL